MGVVLAAKTWDGVEIPAEGEWQIDKSHSTVEFIARHLVVSKVRGRFGEFEGVLRIDEDPAKSSVEVSIDAASIDSRDERRDTHLRSADFLDVENHPALTFSGKGLRKTGKTTFELPGDLTIRGTTRPVVLEVEFDGVTLDPWGNTRAAFTASTEIDREAFGLTWNQALEAGGVLVGNKVKIQIEVAAVHAA